MRDEFLNSEILYSIKELSVLPERWRPLQHRQIALFAGLQTACAGCVADSNLHRAALTHPPVQNIGHARTLPLLRNSLADPFATRLRIIIRFSVHCVGRMHGAEGVVHHIVRLIIGYAGDVRRGKSTAVPRLLSIPKTDLVIHWPFLPKIRMQAR
jgi:hypothetical protein